MSDPKIGLIPLSLPRERKDLAEQFFKEAKGKLSDKRIKIVPPDDLCLGEDSTIEAVRRMENDVDSIIFLIGNWVRASMVVTAVQKASLPFALWADANPASFSLVGAGVTKGSLEDLGIVHKFIYGSPTCELLDIEPVMID